MMKPQPSHDRLSSTILASLATILSLCCSLTALADAPAKLVVKKAEPPGKIAAPIRTVLQNQVLQLTDDGKPFYAFWFRKQVPLAEKTESEEPAVQHIKEGTLLGVLEVYEERFDFRDEEIPPGLYTLRFSIQPEDGDHVGTSPTKTFLLLVPAKEDKKLDSFADPEDLYEAAAAVNAAEHPANLNLQPVEKKEGEFPRLVSHHKDTHKVIYLQIPAQVPGEKKTVLLTFAVVYDGIGEV